MQISYAELKRVLTHQGVVGLDRVEEEPSPRPTDGPLIKALTQEIMEMPDREDRVAELKARIEAGTYNVDSAEIAEAMIRRSLADRVR